MDYQKTNLFGETGTAAPDKSSLKRLREKRIKQAFEHTSTAFRTRYEQFVMEYAETHPDFIAEDITLAYKTRRDLPQPVDFRATGRIFQKLLEKGKIRAIGFRNSKVRCSPMAIYTKV